MSGLPLKCHYCGRFIADAELAWEQPYVSDLAVRLEPPEQVPVCPSCLSSDEEESRAKVMQGYGL